MLKCMIRPLLGTVVPVWFSVDSPSCVLESQFVMAYFCVYFIHLNIVLFVLEEMIGKSNPLVWQL